MLDRPGAELPDNIEATIAPLDRRAILGAARVCGHLLVGTWPRAMAAVGAGSETPPPLARWVQSQLDSVPT